MNWFYLIECVTSCVTSYDSKQKKYGFLTVFQTRQAI